MSQRRQYDFEGQEYIFIDEEGGFVGIYSRPSPQTNMIRAYHYLSLRRMFADLLEAAVKAREAQVKGTGS